MMKTFLPLKLKICLAVLGFATTLSAQTTQGLVFKNPTLISGTNNQVNAVYLFQNVKEGFDATVKVDSAVNGAQLNKIDDNSGGLGYLNALQPEVKIPSGTGRSYIVMTIDFLKAGTQESAMLDIIQGTALDIDGNLLLKEFVELGMAGGTASYQTGTLDISVLQMLFNRFKGENILGIERDGIDTTAMGNMFTVTKNYISSFTVKFGATTVANGNTNRQFSLYMKGFNYVNTTTLPIKLKSFDAYLKADKKVDLKWITSSEINVSHFVVERSTDGTTYTDAGLVFAYGNSTEDKNYMFADNLASVDVTDIVYYRLRSVDIDGKSQYSDVRIIKTAPVKASNTLTIITYPNPVTNQLRITVPANWQNKKLVYEIFKVNGQLAQRTENANSSQTETLNVSQLSPGLYIVRVNCNGEIAQQKIIKQ